MTLILNWLCEANNFINLIQCKGLHASIWTAGPEAGPGTGTSSDSCFIQSVEPESSPVLSPWLLCQFNIMCIVELTPVDLASQAAKLIVNESC